MKQILKKISDLIKDPLGQVFICEWETDDFVIRWNSGFIQLRRMGDKRFGFGIPAREFIDSYNSIDSGVKE